MLVLQELQARLRERREEKEAADAAKMEHLEEREVRVSQAEDTDAREYRKLVMIFVPFILFFAMAMCFLCDTPLVRREFEKSMAEIEQPFNTTDPFMSGNASTLTSPVWMLPHADCNPSPKSFPSTQPQVSYCRMHIVSRAAFVASFAVLVW